MSIVANIWKEHMTLLEEYQRTIPDVKLTCNDIGLESLRSWKKGETVIKPIFIVDNKKISLSNFLDLIKKFEDRKLSQDGNKYILSGKINIGYNTSDKFNPIPLYEDKAIEFETDYSIEFLKHKLKIS